MSTIESNSGDQPIKPGKRNDYQRLRHARRERERQARRRAENRRIIQASFARGCILCGCVGPDLEHHHRDPREKKFDVAHGTCRSTAAVLREIDKCVVLCRSDHRNHHRAELTLRSESEE
jgi:hypothetical protein